MEKSLKTKLELARIAKAVNSSFKLPDFDKISVDYPEQNIEEYSYFLKDTLVKVCTVTYTDNSKRDISTVEWADE